MYEKLQPVADLLQTLGATPCAPLERGADLTG
jgi:hypothetical protein